MANATEGRGLCVAPFLELSHFSSKEGCESAVNCHAALKQISKTSQICQAGFVPLFPLQEEALSAVYHAPFPTGSIQTVSHCPSLVGFK